jgi:DNA-binding transcriptional MocR family regulator
MGEFDMWTPEVLQGDGPLYARLADALGEDIALGKLSAGAKLPTHRDLAYRLSIGVGTVTKAYEEAERRGLIEAHVGRGSFVARPIHGTTRRTDGLLNLAMNTAPVTPTHARIPEAMSALKRLPNLAELFSYAPPLGHEADRRAGADWLKRVSRLEDVGGRITICTLGVQHAMSLLFAALLKPGETVLAEKLNYVGLKALADHAGYALRGVVMDCEGLCPEALERAVRETGARVVYTVPTLHNPTARVMSMARRQAIADVARRLDLTIIEDDIYAHFASSLDICPIANFAPERTYLISGLSKAVAPGLRAGYLALPDESLLDRLTQISRATIFAPSGVPFALASLMINNGMAEAITQEVHEEIRARTIIAMEFIGDAVEHPATPASLHLWLPMGELEAERVAGRAGRAGLSLQPPIAAAIEGDAETGLRVSLGAIESRAGLTEALTRLRGVLSGEIVQQERGLI